jgi:hypothetical protein
MEAPLALGLAEFCSWVSWSPLRFASHVLRSSSPEAQRALGLAEFSSLRSSGFDRDLLSPRSGEGDLARALRELDL